MTKYVNDNNDYSSPHSQFLVSDSFWRKKKHPNFYVTLNVRTPKFFGFHYSDTNFHPIRKIPTQESSCRKPPLALTNKKAPRTFTTSEIFGNTKFSVLAIKSRIFIRSEKFQRRNLPVESPHLVLTKKKHTEFLRRPKYSTIRIFLFSL